MLNEIVVKKAAQHNLKRIDVRLPRNQLIVVTGPSGSGKSSLAFDTLFAEGQRRYIECMSAYARQYMEMMEKPEVESIEGISPAISIDQKTISANPRSTVGTVTEIYDFLRLLFARVGVPHCPSCGRPVNQQSAGEIVARIMETEARPRVKVLAPVIKGRKGEYHRLFDRLLKKGFIRIRVDGRFRDLDGPIVLEKTRKHSAEVLIDEIRVAPHAEKRAPGGRRRAPWRSADGRGPPPRRGRPGDPTIRRSSSARSATSACPSSSPGISPSTAPTAPVRAATASATGPSTDEWGEVELTEDLCDACRGARLKPESLAVRVGGKIHRRAERPARRAA